MSRYIRIISLSAFAVVAALVIYGAYIDQRSKEEILKVFPEEDFLFEVLQASQSDVVEQEAVLVQMVMAELSSDQVRYVRENLCSEQTMFCVRLALITANYFSKVDSSRYKTLVTKSIQLSKDYFESSASSCPIAHELARLNIAVINLRNSSDRKVSEAKTLIEFLNSGSGLDFSIVSAQCQNKFDQYVWAYQAYLALLAEVYLYSDQIDASSFLLSFKNIERFLSLEFQIARD